MRTPTLSVEVITMPVSDVERALRFYVDQVGFTVDVDYSPNSAFRVVQLTPPGSSCSIRFVEVEVKTDFIADHPVLPGVPLRHVDGQSVRHNSKLGAATRQLLAFAL